MRRMIYALQATLENIRTQKLMTLVSATAICISLIFPGFLFLFYDNLQMLLQGLRGNVQIMVYLDERASEADVVVLREKIQTEKGVAQVSFTSKEKAREEFKKMQIDDAILDQLEGNPFPASFAVTLRPQVQENERYLVELADRFRKIKGVEEVHYGAEWLSFLNLLLKKIRTIGMVIGLLLGMTVMTLIALTIRLNFYARQAEMEILRLIGASRAYIRLPYLLEGGFLGAVASATSLLVLKGLYDYVQGHLSGSGPWIGGSYQLRFFTPSLIAFLLAGGGMLGAIGSLISLIWVDHE